MDLSPETDFARKMQRQVGDKTMVKPPTRLELYELAGNIAESFRDLRKRLEKLEELEKSRTSEVAQLRELLTAKSAVAYRGVWRPGGYKAGDMVTHGGSMWHANRDTDESPAAGSGTWTLAVKKGRDGKDAGR